MKPALQLDVFVAFFPYGGNGGVQSEHPDIRDWWCETLLKMKSDPRIGSIVTRNIADTPICMTRNKAVRIARNEGCHLVLMIDSDQSPNKHKGERWFKPFWDEAFNFVYANYLKGPHVVAAPYCGPPDGSENVYVFKWENFGDRGDETNFKLEAYSREDAEKMSGIQEAAALPTGLILYDIRAFDLIEPSKLTKRQVLEHLLSGEMTVEEAESSLYDGYFHYEWKDQYADEKGSTEDVSNTRNIAMNGIVKLGYNPIHCAWDCWIGHWKPWNVGKPKSHKTEHVGAVFKKIVINDNRTGEKIIDMKMPAWAKDGAVRQVKAIEVPNPTGELPLPKRTAAKPEAKITKHYTGRCDDTLHYTGLLADNGFMVELGPGKQPHPLANEYVGLAPEVEHQKPFHKLDLNNDRLPYADKSVDFLYCRHLLEELENPVHLLREIRRVAKSGYIETTGPLVECCKDVDQSCGACEGTRGFKNHHTIIWSDGKTLRILPKLPCIHSMDVPDRYDILNSGARHWNSYHQWEGDLEFEVLTTENYRDSLSTAYRESLISAESFALDVGANIWRFIAATSPIHLQALAKEIKPGDRVLEVGSWLGASATAMADAGAIVHCVDTWAGSDGECGRELADNAGGPEVIFEEFKRRIGDRLDKSIFPYRKSSLDAAAMYWDKFDIIFIDAEHSYEACKADILAWWPHLKDDGVMLGHDYGTVQFPGVDKAVHELFGRHGFQTLGDCRHGSIWKVRKADFPHLLERSHAPATA